MFTNNETEKRNNFAIEGLLDDAELNVAMEGLDASISVATPPPGSVLIFDYSKITEDAVRKQAQDAATRIQTNMLKAQAAFLDIGRDLLNVKDTIGYTRARTPEHPAGKRALAGFLESA